MPDIRNDSLEAGNPRLDLILGVISMGKQCRRDKAEASAHTDVSSFFSWINETISTGTCLPLVIAYDGVLNIDQFHSHMDY